MPVSAFDLQNVQQEKKQVPVLYINGWRENTGFTAITASLENSEWHHDILQKIVAECSLRQVQTDVSLGSVTISECEFHCTDYRLSDHFQENWVTAKIPRPAWFFEKPTK